MRVPYLTFHPPERCGVGNSAVPNPTRASKGIAPPELPFANYRKHAAARLREDVGEGAYDDNGNKPTPPRAPQPRSRTIPRRIPRPCRVGGNGRSELNKLAVRQTCRNSPPGQLGNAPLYAAIVRCLRKPAALRQPSPLHDKIP